MQQLGNIPIWLILPIWILVLCTAFAALAYGIWFFVFRSESPPDVPGFEMKPNAGPLPVLKEKENDHG